MYPYIYTYNPADSLVGNIDGFLLHCFEVVRVRSPWCPTAVWCTLHQGVFAVGNLPVKFIAYMMAWQFKFVDNKIKVIIYVHVSVTLLHCKYWVFKIICRKLTNWNNSFASIAIKWNSEISFIILKYL